MTTYGSILHGAYGDYYEQSLCLKHFKRTHPGSRLELFFASEHRMSELEVFDWSFADGIGMWTEIDKRPVDEFIQFQIKDDELASDVLQHLSPSVLGKLDRSFNRLPWHTLRRILPISPEFQLRLSQAGHAKSEEIMVATGLAERKVFERPTLGFLWRYRAPGGYVKNVLPSDPIALAAKYSRAFTRIAETWGCHVLIAGMKVKTTDENRFRVDAKYPEYGLDISPSLATHLPGASWGAELELISRCDVLIGNPSGFTEALYAMRGSDMILVDPPLQYLGIMTKHRMPLFDYLTPKGFLHAWTQPHTEGRIVRDVGRSFERKGFIKV